MVAKREVASDLVTFAVTK